MSNLDLEKVGEPEIKLLTSAGTQIKERNTHTHTHTKKKSIKTTYTWSMDVRISFCIIEGFPYSSAGIESTCNAGDLGSIPGLGGSPGEGKSYPLQYLGLYSSWGGKGSDTAERLSLSASLTMLKPLTVWITIF